MGRSEKAKKKSHTSGSGAKSGKGGHAAAKPSVAARPAAHAPRSGQSGNGREKSAPQKPWHMLTPEEIEALPFKARRLITIRRRHENMKREIEMIREDMENEDEED